MSAADYTNRVLVKQQLGITDSTEDSLIDKAIAAASRAIDRHTGTTFYPVTETRRFASSGGVVWIDRFTDTAGLVIKTGTGGSYPTTLTSAQYVLEPYNAPSRGLAYDRISAPYAVAFAGGNADYPDVEITAKWGYATVPDDIEMACRIKAVQLFQRKDTPYGVGGSSEYGEVRMSDGEDRDIALLLRPYTDFGWA